MKNWNTNTSKFKNDKDKRIWQLSQIINYGLEKTKLNVVELKENWTRLKPLLDPERARMLEYIIWKRTYSLPSNEPFWKLSPKTAI